jgi:hypothetical protein
MAAYSRHAALALLLPALAGPASACGTDAIGIDACRRIESARCKAAPTCHVALDPPHTTAGTDVDACIRFYDTACLHGLAVNSDPGTTAVNACVAAIGDHPCSPGGANLVQTPEQDPACAWLVPPPAAADAGSGAADGPQAEASDASGGSG